MGEEESYDEVQTLEYQPSHNRESQMVPEIVEIEEENDECKEKMKEDVYVAVGKDDVQVLKWVLAHAVVPGTRVNLIHVFPPITSISTPVGRLWVGQLSPEQANIYAIEEINKRKILLHKYIRLCLDNKVIVDTILIESSETTKAILELVPVLNMTSLVLGTKHPRSSRQLIKGSSRGAFIQKNAPDYCKVTLVYAGKKYMDNQGKMHQISSPFKASSDEETKVTPQKYERNHLQCTCFPVKFL